MTENLARQRPLYSGDRDIRTASAPVDREDPLAELARLVGRDDPFRDIFPPRTAPAQAVEHDMSPEHVGHGSQPDATAYEGAVPYVDESGHVDDLAAYEAYMAHEARRRATETPQQDSLRFPALPTSPDEFSDSHADFSDHGHQHGEAPPLHADLWAEGMPEPTTGELDAFVPASEIEAEERPGQSRKRTLVVLAAVVALTGGGLAATFLVRGGGAHSATASGGTAPTILADTAPIKVQPPETTNAATGGDGTTALLEKSASDNVANAKVVNAQERPVDLDQLPKTQQTAADTNNAEGAQQAASPFPEPRKVKTILIRPDGTVVGEAPAQQAVAGSSVTPGVVMPTPASPTPAARSTSPVAAEQAPTPKPTTPKATARAAVTPKPATTTAVAKPKPTETAAAETAPVAASAAAGGGTFAVQLAAPPSEDEAKSTVSRLQKKFADSLSRYKPAIRKASSGTKSVYRVRIENLSQDDAKALCTKLQAGGGSCFVIHS